MYDCIVIGKGLIGTAAAKYLTTAGKRVALIGPDEPINTQEGIVFSSHYDEARIQRIIGADATWTLLNQQSAEVYPALQQDSGINFHTSAGCLYVNPVGIDPYIEQAKYLGRKFNCTYNDLPNVNSLKTTFPDFSFPKTAAGIFEKGPSGYINPRRLIQAQLEIFEKNNGTIIKEIGVEITYEKEAVKILTSEGNSFQARKVLITAGAFTNSFRLLEIKLDLRLKSETTIWVKINKEDASRMKNLPCLLYEIDEPEIQNIYLIQPVQYPDGHYYLKMGSNIPQDIYFEGLEPIQDWFRKGDNRNHVSILKRQVQQLLPGLRAEAFIPKKCIVTRTRHGKPYIGEVKENVFVAAGGNGYGAMCSDALGRIAGHVVTNHYFPPGYNENDFLPVMQNKNA